MRPLLITTIAYLTACCFSLAAVKLKKIASGFQRPIWLACPPGNNQQAWIVEQSGKIWFQDLQTQDRSGKLILD